MTKQLILDKNGSGKILGYGDLGALVYLEQYNDELYLEIGNYQLDFKLIKGEFKLAELRLLRR